MIEVEIKIKADLSKTAEKLTTLGFSRKNCVFEKDIYFNGIGKDLKSEDKALRIREKYEMTPEGTQSGPSRCVLNFKGPKMDSVTMSRSEIQFEIPDYEKGRIILEGLGFFPAGRVEKIRTHFLKDNITCCLDSVTDLGDFLEIEIMAQDETSYAEALGKIRMLLKELELSWEDTIRYSYLSMQEMNKSRKDKS